MGQASSKKGATRRDRSEFVARLVIAGGKQNAGGGQARGGEQEAETELLEEAKRQLLRGDLRSAEKSLVHVVKHAPANLEAKIILAKVLLSQGGRYFTRAEDLYYEVLKQEPRHPQGLAGYGIFLGKHAKDYESAEQVLLLASHADPSSRSLLVLHLQAQKLAKLDDAEGRDQQANATSAPVIPMGAGPTVYGAMCEPPDDDAVVGWCERKFPDYGMNIRAGYMSEGGHRYTNVMRDEDAGKIIVPTGLSLSLSLSFSLSLSLCVSACLSLSLYLYLYLFLSLALALRTLCRQVAWCQR